MKADNIGPNGCILITLEEYVERNKTGPRPISKNKIVAGARVQRTQLNNYCKSKVARVDLNVLARICDFLECDLSDIMRYENE